jgi:hypothetical protein
MSTADADRVRSRLEALRLAMESLEGLARSPREETIAAEGRQALQELEAWLLDESKPGERAA